MNFLSTKYSAPWNRRRYAATCVMANDLHSFLLLGDTNILYHDSLEDIANSFLEIVSCFKQRTNSVNVFICDLSSVN